MNLASKHNDPDGKLNMTEIIGFGMGAIPARLVFQVISTFLTIYLTNVVFLDIAAVSAIIGVSKLFDGISDLIIGRLIHFSHSRMGKARAWLLRMCLPLALTFFLLFNVPSGCTTIIKYIYVFVFFNLTTTVFLTFMQISEYSLLPLITRNKGELSKLSSSMTAFGSLAGLITSVFFVRLLLVFTDQAGMQNTQRAYTCTVLIFAVIVVTTALFSVLSTKERVITDAGDHRSDGVKESIIKTAGKLVTDRYWLILFIMNIIDYITQQAMIGSTSYFALYILKDMGSIGWLLPAFMASMILIQFATPGLIHRFGTKRVYILGFVLAAFCTVCTGLAVPHKAAILVLQIFRGMGVGMKNAAFYIFVTDVIKHTSRKIGVNTTVLCNAGFTAGEKIGQGAGIAIFGLVMSLAGFNGALKIQPPTVNPAIMTIYAWAPGILLLTIAIVFAILYDLE